MSRYSKRDISIGHRIMTQVLKRQNYQVVNAEQITDVFEEYANDLIQKYEAKMKKKDQHIFRLQTQIRRINKGVQEALEE